MSFSELQEICAEELLSWRRKLLLEGGTAEDLDWLLDIGGGIGWSTLQRCYLDSQHVLKPSKSCEELEAIWLEYLRNQIPLQYLIGVCPWRDVELEVSPKVMIPRQESEILVELALHRFGDNALGTWVDLGTGSGALAVSLARAFPFSQGHAVDLSQDALLLAKRNVKRLAPTSTVSFHCGSWWDPLKPFWGQINLVLANPPYIPDDLIKELDPVVINHEPHLALCGGSDGLNASRVILEGAMESMASKGWLILEHHHDQSDQVMKIMRDLGFQDVGFEVDLQGIRRFAFARRP